MADYKILVPLDGSRTAEHALVYLQAFRRMGNCIVRLLAVADESEDYHQEPAEDALNREANLLSAYLREVAKDVEQHSGVMVEMKVVRGRPAVRVAEEAEAFGPDLLIVCTHGRTGISRWRLGSVVDKVVRGVACNVLVVGPSSLKNEAWIDAGIERPFESILVPLDGSELANKAVPVALQFAGTFASTLHLMRVVSLPTYGITPAGEAYIPDLLNQVEDAARDYLCKVVAGLPEEVPTVTAVETGDAATNLVGYQKAHNIDLVVMTSHGRGGFVRTALGSVADRLLADAPAPVLLVRAG